MFLISRRWGKSFLITLLAIEDCIRRPNSQIFIVGPDLKHTRKIMTPLIKIITADAPEGLITQNKSELSWTIGESTLIIGAFDTALEAFRGLEAHAIYIEETGLTNIEDYEYILKSVLRPTLMHSRGRIVHATTPPKEENHPFIYTTMLEAENNNALYRYTIRDNPLLSPQDIEEEIQISGGLDSPHCRRELFCEVVREKSRVIVPEFQDTHILPLTLPKYAYFLTALDFGGVMDPHAAILTYYDFERNKFCIYDEVWLPVNTGTKEIVQAVLDMEKKHGVKWLNGAPRRVTDAPGQVLVDLKQMGFDCTPPTKGKDSVEDGIQALRVECLRGRVEIDPRCNITAQTFKYGMWDKNRKGFQRTDILGHCDALAAASYALRHIDKHTNPFPPSYQGLTRESHYFIRSRRPDTMEDILTQAFGLDD